jgi:hypothetical protein
VMEEEEEEEVEVEVLPQKKERKDSRHRFD